MARPIYVVDAFTSRPFAGNPASVCILDSPEQPEWMQRVAAEMKHAETAFLVARDDKSYELRWFTPTTEVDLCGHATLAAAHVLWETHRLAEEAGAVFHTQSGTLRCTRHGFGIQMDFPAEPATECDLPISIGFKGGVEWTGKNRLDWIVVASDSDAVRKYEPDFAAIEDAGMRGLILTAKSNEGDVDFVSRFFAPQSGVAEDPVTGSAHCCLGPYWATALGKSDVVGYQCSERGGTVRVAVRGDRVLLQGHAITILCGELLV